MDIEDIGTGVGFVLAGIGVIVIIAIIIALPTMWLWNYLMPVIFGLPEIGFWQALCLNILSGILIKGSTTVNKK